MLIAKNLTRTIDGHVLWSGLTLTLAAGERVALRGPTGSGKTLLMRSLIGLDYPDEGEIKYLDRNIKEWNIPDFRRRVRYIPQDAAFVAGSVRDSISLFFSFQVNRNRELNESLLNTCVDILGLPVSFLDKTADYLSGGEKQLVALLRSLLLEPEILLLDEPTSNLDEVMAGRVEQMIRVWIEQNPDRAYLWTSHDSRQLDRMTNSSITLKHSKLASPDKLKMENSISDPSSDRPNKNSDT